MYLLVKQLEFIKIIKMKLAIKNLGFRKVYFSSILIFCQYIMNSQTVSLEAPTISLSPAENSTVADITLNAGQTTITALTFSVIFDNNVISPTGISISGGASNIIGENEIRIAIYAVNSQLASIDFDYIGAGGTQSPLMISIIDLFDSNGNDISATASVIDGSINKSCVTNSINGCTNFNYEEYDPFANCDDGTCSTLVCHDTNFQKINQYDNYTAARPQLSSSGNRVVFIDNGFVKLFEAQNNSWEQIGPDLALDLYSYGVTLSGDGNKIALISYDSSTSPRVYYVQTYFLINNEWIKPTDDFSSISTNINYVKLSDNGNNLLISYRYASDERIDVFEWIDSDWQQKGDSFMGEFWYPKLSNDGNTILFSDSYVGTVTSSIYTYNGSSWSQKGSLIGENAIFNLDHSGNIVLSIEYETPGVWVDPELTFYAFDENNWIQIGATQSFIGAVGNEMSGDLSNFTITDRNNFIDIYKYDGLEWNNVNTLTYENNGFRFWSCQFSQDGNALIVRGYWHDDDDVGLTAYYANECNAVSQMFCVDTQVLNGVIDAGIYSADNKIIASGIVDIQSGGNVELEAQNMVDLMPGFSVEDDVNFEIRMQTCDPNN